MNSGLCIEPVGRPLRRAPLRIRFLLFLFIPLLAQVQGAEPTVDAKDLPRVPATEPPGALKTFKVKPGFHLDIAASEPLVIDPVAMSFDENGRLYVVEMRDYSERRDERLGRIRLLEDTDGDGHFDKSTVFAEGLPWPTAVICYDGGIFVGATPDIWYLKDTNNDGIADQKKLIFTGFAQTAAGQEERLNVQGLFNSFNWTLDNRIHGASGTMGGFVHIPGSTNGISVRGRDFSFDPRNPSDLRAETGGGQHGLTFDNAGRKFVCHNSSHIRLAMYEQRYADRNSGYVLPPGLLDIPADGPSAEVYRISPEEPWRVIRTAWRVAGKVSGPVEGGGRSSGYFTSATGITIYRGNAFPEEFLGDAFIADVGSNLIHRKKLYPNGAALIAKRAPDEEKVEFIASRDLWFRPVQFANAPDGTLYVADMYREVVEHPWSLPESIKKHLDLNSGNDRGRIYRILPDNFQQPALPRLGSASTAALVATLENANGWHRDTAARLLYQRQDKKAVALLQKLAAGSSSAMGRMHALYALHGLHALKESELATAMGDANEMVRMHAVRLVEQTAAKPANKLAGLVRTKLISLADDPSPMVRYQLAFTLGEVEVPERVAALAKIAKRDPVDPWIRAAVLSSVRDGAPGLFQLVASDAGAAEMGPWITELVKLMAARLDTSELAALIHKFEAESNKAVAYDRAQSLASGLERAGRKQQALFEPLFQSAAQSAGSRTVPEQERLAAIKLLGYSSFERAKGLTALLDPAETPALQSAALRTLGRFSNAAGNADLLARWNSLTPSLRSELLDIMISRADRATLLLKEVQAGKITPSDFSPVQLRALRTHPSDEVRKSAERLIVVPTTASSRDQVIAQYRTALDLPGKADSGKALYVERCATCHRAGGQGNAVGPDFASMKNSGKEKLLVNIIDPNREVPPQYLAYTAETKSGDVYTGILSAETSANISLLQPNGQRADLPRAQLLHFQSQKQSLMPEGLENGLSAQQMADLLAYILESR